MKKRLSKSLSIIGIFSIISIIVIIFIIIKVRGDDKNNSNSGSNINTGECYSDIEMSSYHNVSNGGLIYAFNSVPDAVIEGAKKYIRENGYDNSQILFSFRNSRETFGPKYIAENVLDVYDPRELTEEYTGTSTEYLYYVLETYKRNEDSNYICVGYFAINENGVVTEAQHLKTAEELSSYTIEPDIGADSLTQAKKFLSLDENATIDQSMCFFYYDEDGNAVLCYRYRFDDGNEIYFNGITGEKIK